MYFNVTEPLLRLCLWEVNLKFILCINYAQNTYAWCLYPITRKHSSRMRTCPLADRTCFGGCHYVSERGGGVSQVLGPGGGYTMGPGIPTPLGKLIPLDQFRHRHNYPLWTYPPWKYPSLSPGHTHPLLVTPGGHYWRHTTPTTGGQTETCENITFWQLHLRAVKKGLPELISSNQWDYIADCVQ